MAKINEIFNAYMGVRGLVYLAVGLAIGAWLA